MVTVHSLLPLCGIPSEGAELLCLPRGCCLVWLTTFFMGREQFSGNSDKSHFLDLSDFCHFMVIRGITNKRCHRW